MSPAAPTPPIPSPDSTAPAPATRPVRVIAAATIGNALEWFDIAIYAMLAIYIGRVFFPDSDPGVQLVQAFGVFGVTYLIRPLGGLLLGPYAHRRGRKKALVLSIRLMVVGTGMIVIMPGYATIGLFAPLGIVVARLIQGFAAGGGFGAATSLLVEQNGRRRGFLGSFQFASQGMATLLAAGFASGLTALLSEADMTAWGWRIPFAFGLLVGPVGYYIRRHVDDSPAMADSDEGAERVSSQLGGLFRYQWGGLLIAGGVLVVSTALNFILQYLPTFGISELGLPPSFSFLALVITGAILTFVTPLVGQAGDMVGRVRIMLPAALLIGVSVVPLFLWLTAARTFGVLVVVMVVLGLLKALYYGALPSVMADAFPVRSRATGLSFSYNITVVAFGGSTPTIAAVGVATTGRQESRGYYLLAVSFVSVAALLAAVRWRGIR